MAATAEVDIEPVPPQPDNDEADEKKDQKNVFEESAESLSVASLEKETSACMIENAFLSRAWAVVSWTPKRCRWDPEKPPPFSLPLNLLFGFVSPLYVFPSRPLCSLNFCHQQASLPSLQTVLSILD